MLILKKAYPSPLNYFDCACELLKKLLASLYSIQYYQYSKF